MRPQEEGAARAPFLSLFGFLTILGLIQCPPSVLAQQSPPLQGQGLDPFLASVPGYDITNITDDNVIPIYMTIELAKLLILDEQDYTFDVLLNVQQSWTDPRALATWSLIDERDRLARTTPNKTTQADDVQSCYTSKNASSTPCQSTLSGAPSCTKYCGTYGTTTDNPSKCCDLVWLPAMQLRNLVFISQDRVVKDVISSFPNVDSSDDSDAVGVHRETAIYGRFTAPMHFQDYPFDKQTLQIFISPDPPSLSQSIGLLTYYIEPSATFRRLNQAFIPGPNFTGEVQALNRDELGNWNIDSVTFTCGEVNTTGTGRAKGGQPVFEQTQNFSSDDIYNHFLGNFSSECCNSTADLNNQLLQTCALTIVVSRLSSTLVVQSVVPVAFVGALSFVIFFVSPDAVDFRVGTEVTLFLSLTAMQFIFVSMLPLASYLTKLDIFILLTYCTIVILVAESLLAYFVCTRVEHISRGGKYATVSQRERERQHQHKKQQQQEEGQEQEQGEEQQEDGEEASHMNRSGRDVAAAVQQAKKAGDQEQGVGGEQGRDSSKWEPDGAKLMGSADSREGEPEAKQGWFRMPRKPAFLTYWSPDVLAEDPALAYHLACKIDRITGVVLFFLYVLLSVLCLTVGFS